VPEKLRDFLAALAGQPAEGVRVIEGRAAEPRLPATGADVPLDAGELAGHALVRAGRRAFQQLSFRIAQGILVHPRGGGKVIVVEVVQRGGQDLLLAIAGRGGGRHGRCVFKQDRLGHVVRLKSCGFQSSTTNRSPGNGSVIDLNIVLHDRSKCPVVAGFSSHPPGAYRPS
jgi:hypothetical protein